MLFHFTFTLKEAWQVQISTSVSLTTVCYYVYVRKEIHTTDLFPLPICA